MENVIGQVMIDQSGNETLLIHLAYHGKYVFTGGKRVQKVIIACQPQLGSISGWQRSGEPAVVNCPVCKRSEAYRKASLKVDESAYAGHTHLAVQDEVACTDTPGRWRRTDDVRAVTCPLCRESADYLLLDEELKAALAKAKR